MLNLLLLAASYALGNDANAPNYSKVAAGAFLAVALQRALTSAEVNNVA